MAKAKTAAKVIRKPGAVAIRKPSTVVVRWAKPDDLTQIERLAAACNTPKWTVEKLEKCLLSSECNQNRMLFVAEQAGVLLAFAVLSLKPATTNILDLMVLPGRRRQGIGRQLIERVKNRMVHSHWPPLAIRVRESNMAALLMLKGCGFKAIKDKIKRNYYEGSDDWSFYLTCGAVTMNPDLGGEG